VGIQKSYNIWAETAYSLFAERGPEHLTIKELAKRCQLPRTNFYYHFDDKDDLIEEIINLHFRTVVDFFNQELQERLITFMPDLYSILYEFKLGLQFTKTLFKHRDKPKFNEAYKKGVALSAELIVPKFKTYFNISLPHEQLKEFWFTVTDAWYSRLNFEDLSVHYLCALCDEIMDTMLPLIEKSNSTNTTRKAFFSTPLSK